MSYQIKCDGDTGSVESEYHFLFTVIILRNYHWDIIQSCVLHEILLIKTEDVTIIAQQFCLH